jgi:hypothetical protein
MLRSLDDKGIEALRPRHSLVEGFGDFPGRKVAGTEAVADRGDAKIGQFSHV